MSYSERTLENGKEKLDFNVESATKTQIYWRLNPQSQQTQWIQVENEASCEQNEIRASGSWSVLGQLRV